MVLTRVRELYQQKGARVAVSALRSLSPPPISHYVSLFEDEYLTRNDVALSQQERLWCYRRGFMSESYVIYGLNQNDHREYLSDHARYVRTPRLNGRASDLLHNKLATRHMIESVGGEDHLARLHGIVQNGEYRAIRTEAGSIIDLFKTEHAVVCKGMVGGGGGRVDIVRHEDGEFRLNGEAVALSTIERTFSTARNRLVESYVEQADYAAEIYPETPNTIRLITCYDPIEEEAFCPIAIHRFGTDVSDGIDNWSRGGLSVAIDQETGELGEAAQFIDSEVRRMDIHPDSGTQITGTPLPHWERIRDRVLELASDMPYVKHAGWDVIITDDGFVVIEINDHPGNRTLQVHEPLLKNARLRKFYQREEVI